MQRFNTKSQKQQKRPRQLLRNKIKVGTVGQSCDSSASVLEAEFKASLIHIFENKHRKTDGHSSVIDLVQLTKLVLV